uniref:Mannitol 1-phosphate dehydrogenase n=1 Tax=Nannochloropsis gaditana (strain CCMP526) TaxID=1093141 RepID=I2CQS8_NANGC
MADLKNMAAASDVLTCTSKHEEGGAPAAPAAAITITTMPMAAEGPLPMEGTKRSKKGMEPAFLTQLRTSAVDDYRRNYRRFRSGKAHGAQGEGPNADADAEAAEKEEEEQEEMDADTSVYEAENTVVYQRVADFRRRYRSYRIGAAKGIRSDASHKITLEEARVLPVAQLSAFLSTQVAPSLGLRRVVSSINFAHRSTFHLHFGAGRLGLGLVVPAIVKSRVPFAIVNHSSKAWEPITFSPSRDPHVTLTVNKEVVCKDLLVVRDLSELPPSDVGTQGNLFVPTDDPLLLHLLVTTATSFSIALGPSMMKVVYPLLSKLPIIPQGEFRPCLFAAENDHKTVRALAKALEGRVDVREVMVDRICVSREITVDAIDVQAEPYEGEMVILKPPKHLVKGPPSPSSSTSPFSPSSSETTLPFSGNHVRLPSMGAEASMWTRRKFLMVNGTHTTLAFLTLCLRQPRQRPDEHETVPQDHELISWDKEKYGDKIYHDIWCWAVARLFALIWEHELDLMKHAFGVVTDGELIDALLESTVQTLQRFSSIKDTSKRVLSGGVATRWKGRLNDVREFLADFKKPPTPILALLLRKAKLTLPEIKAAVKELCEESYRFTGLGTVTPQKRGKVVCT